MLVLNERSETLKREILKEGIKVTRHDMPTEVQEFIKVAAKHNVIDELDAISLGVTHGNNWRAMIDEVIEWAFASRHYNGMGHKQVVQAAEAYWMTQPIS